jgi:hypothetical protein
MKKILVVQGDTNDADYITNEEDVTKNLDVQMSKIYDLDEGNGETLLQFITRVAAAIKAKGRHNWPTSEYARENLADVYAGILSQQDMDIFSECFCPHGEHGIHTINSIRLITVSEDKEFLEG